MSNQPREKADLSTVKADILSGDPQNIQAALEQVWDIEQWKLMSSPERLDLMRTLMSVCDKDKKVDTGYWQQVCYFMMELEPDFALDLLEWMFTHPDPEMYDRAAKMLTQGSQFASKASLGRAKTFLTFLQAKEPTMASHLAREWGLAA